MQIAELERARIAILGTGREGRSAYNWLRTNLPRKALTLIAESQTDPGFAKTLGRDDQLLIEPLNGTRLKTFDVLIRSPGISIYREPIREAIAAGVRVTTACNLWFAFHPYAKTICITGTKGKSTTAALLSHMMESIGVRTRLAGNIGVPLLDCDEAGADWWVIELSSYQIADLVAAPTISVFLNISPEHLDWHGSERVYWQDKLRLADLTKRGVLIANASDIELAGHFAGAPNLIWFSTFAGIHDNGGQLYDRNILLPVNIPSSLPGRHNLLNISAALTAVGAAGFDVMQAAKAVETFKSLPHRLQFLGRSDGVTYINDSIASTPVATAAALQALGDRPLILIIGGFDRGLDWSRYSKEFLSAPVKAVIGLPVSGPRILKSLHEAGLKPSGGLHEVLDLAAAVALAKAIAVNGDTIVLSPGAPSFNQFADFRDRGRTFTRLCGFKDISE